MGENPTAIRQEIAETREEMGETMEAIGYKTDVSSRAGDYVSDKKDKVTRRRRGCQGQRVLGSLPRRAQPRRHQAPIAAGGQQRPS